MKHAEKEATPINDKVSEAKWCYVETAFTAKVIAGDVELLPHWSGPARPDEIRAVVRKAAAAPALYEAVNKAITQLDTATKVGNLSAYTIMHTVKSELRAALAVVDGPQES